MPPLRTTLFALGLVSTVASCGLLTGPSDRDRLEAARARWASHGLHQSYSFDFQRSCFCGYPGALPPTGVEVILGAVAFANDRATGAPLGAEALATIPTVEGLFDLIETAIREHAAEVRVRYDPEHGAPLEIWIDRIRHAIDDEMSITTGHYDEIIID